MKQIFSVVLLIFIFSIASCRKDFSTLASVGKLEFSKDTVFLDTVFTNIGSSTYNLKVYNRSSNAITIPSIALENGNNSNYRLNIDGIPGKSFQNIDILAKDSIYVFIETTIDVNTVNNPLYTDKILFDTGINQQDVDLVTLVQDAVFLFPNKNAQTMEIDSLMLDGSHFAQGRFLNDNELIFTNEKPYVIYGYIGVPKNKTLLMEAGTKVHFHNNSGLVVDKNASLKINGTLETPVTIEGDRLEHYFSNIAGQWGTIWLRAGSKNNEINYAIIKNGIAGIVVDSLPVNTNPVLSIHNTQLHNNTAYGIYGRETSIIGSNLVIGKSGQASLACTIGGSYDFTHCTFANFWENSSRQLPAVLVNNFFQFTDANGIEYIERRNLNKANFTNCIITGNSNIEFILDKIEGTIFNYQLSHSMIQFNDVNNLYESKNELNFNDNTHYQNIILNSIIAFKNSSQNNFIVDESFEGIDRALKNAAQQIPLDILGKDRSNNPDIGAYQHIIFEETEN